jgi:hypothetical protein
MYTEMAKGNWLRLAEMAKGNWLEYMPKWLRGTGWNIYQDG